MDLGLSDRWQGRRVLITGCTGFKGSWLTFWLTQRGAIVTGYALAAHTKPSLWHCLNLDAQSRFCQADVTDMPTFAQAVSDAQPDIIFHMAAQALVRDAYTHPRTTFETNVMGTVNVLEIAKTHPCVKAVIIVTTDKVYDNKEWVWGYREDDRLGGYDPYSASKSAVELVTQAYTRSFFFNSGTVVASVRAGNVIGGGDWSVDRLIPDVIRASSEKKPLNIRYPKAVRPWQHVMAPLSGYIRLADAILDDHRSLSGPWNFGPAIQDCVSVETVLAQIQSRHLPEFKWDCPDIPHLHEAGYLRLDWSKAQLELGWQPRWGLERGLAETMAWYSEFFAGADMTAVTLTQIERYFE